MSILRVNSTKLSRLILLGKKEGRKIKKKIFLPCRGNDDDKNNNKYQNNFIFVAVKERSGGKGTLKKEKITIEEK